MFGYMDISRHGQHSRLSMGEAVGPDLIRVRYVVDHDTSYAFQSSAHAEVWNPATLTWNKAADYDYGAWAGDTSREGEFTGGGYQALIELKHRVRALLGLPT